MAADRIWTVARFPNGSWSYGGRPDSPDYEHCEVWQIEAKYPMDAVKKAQAKRRRDNRKKTAPSPATTRDLQEKQR